MYGFTSNAYSVYRICLNLWRQMSLKQRWPSNDVSSVSYKFHRSSLIPHFTFPSINLATYLWKSTSANLLQPSEPSKFVSVYCITVASTNIQVVIYGRFLSVYCIVDFSSNTLSCVPVAFTLRVTIRRGCYEVLFWFGELGRKLLSKQVRCVILTMGFREVTAFGKLHS